MTRTVVFALLAFAFAPFRAFGEGLIPQELDPDDPVPYVRQCSPAPAGFCACDSQSHVAIACGVNCQAAGPGYNVKAAAPSGSECTATCENSAGNRVAAPYATVTCLPQPSQPAL